MIAEVKDCVAGSACTEPPAPSEYALRLAYALDEARVRIDVTSRLCPNLLTCRAHGKLVERSTARRAALFLLIHEPGSPFVLAAYRTGDLYDPRS